MRMALLKPNPRVSTLSVYSETCSAASSKRRYLRSPSVKRKGIYFERSTNHSPGSEPRAGCELSTISEIGSDRGTASSISSSASPSSISTCGPTRKSEQPPQDTHISTPRSHFPSHALSHPQL